MAIIDELVAVLGYDLKGEAEARRFEQSMDRMNKRVNEFAATVGRFAAIAGAAAVAGFSALGKSGIETSATFEGYQTALETIEGSSEKAKKALDWISDFGKTTPYEVGEVTDAFIALKAYGIDPIANDALRTLGDTASAMNKPLQQAVEAFADAATFEFERLKQFGIRASQKGDEVTFSWTKNGKELKKTVKKNSEDVRKFLLETMGDRFSGAMMKQSKTWNGMMSNLGDSWTDFKRRIGEGGFFETVKGYLADLLDYIGRLDKDGTLDRWSKNLSSAFTAVAEGAKDLSARIGRHVKFISDHFDKLKTPITVGVGILGLLLVKRFPIVTAITALGLAIEDLMNYLEGADSYFGDFVDAIANFLGANPDAVASAMLNIATAAATLAGAAMGLGMFAGALRKVGSALGLLTEAKAAGGIAALGGAGKAAGEASKAITGPKFGLLGLMGLESALSAANFDFNDKDAIKKRGDQAKGIDDWLKEHIGTPRTWLGMDQPGLGDKPKASPINPNAGLTPLQLSVQNAGANLKKMNATNAAQSVVNDNSDQSVNTSNVTINQTVTQAVEAPRALAEASGKALSGAAGRIQNRARLRASPAQ